MNCLFLYRKGLKMEILYRGYGSRFVHRCIAAAVYSTSRAFIHRVITDKGKMPLDYCCVPRVF